MWVSRRPGRAPRTPIADGNIGYLEAHIEQGPVARKAAISKIGGRHLHRRDIWQYRITFTGEQNHAGTTRNERSQGCGPSRWSGF